MTPTAETFTISKELTGYTEDQTINPQELNLWRVFQINNDGTIEIISEYASSKSINFLGETGYKNSVGVLNILASAYTNSKYTIGSRYPGYNGQTQFLTIDHLSIETSGDTTPSNGMNSTEAVGGGDFLFYDDQLILNRAGILKAKSKSSDCVNYWFAGRSYNATTHIWRIRGYACTPGYVLEGAYVFSDQEEFQSSPVFNVIRPIVILKSNLESISGDGSSESPWTFE